MRLIDADAIVYELTEMVRHNTGEYKHGIDVARFITMEAPTVGGWIKCTPDTMPKSGKHVFVTCEIRSLYGSKQQYVCEAFHADTYSIREGKYLGDTDCYDYCEEDDEYYLKEGWYEVIHNWDEYGSIIIGDFVTHWMPLPEPPKEVTTDD